MPVEMNYGRNGRVVLLDDLEEDGGRGGGAQSAQFPLRRAADTEHRIRHVRTLNVCRNQRTNSSTHCIKNMISKLFQMLFLRFSRQRSHLLIQAKSTQPYRT